MKNPLQKIETDYQYKGIEFKNEWERSFAIWLDRMVSFGYIIDWSYESRTFDLLPRNEITDGVIKSKVISSCQYTPDFVVTLGDSWLQTKINWVTSPDGKVYIETKGRRGGHGYYDTLLKMKLLNHIYDNYCVNLVVYLELYYKTFTPCTSNKKMTRFNKKRCRPSAEWIQKALKYNPQKTYRQKCIYFEETYEKEASR